MDSQRAGGAGRGRAGLDGVHVQGEIRIFVLGLLSTLSLTLSLSLFFHSFPFSPMAVREYASPCDYGSDPHVLHLTDDSTHHSGSAQGHTAGTYHV